MTELKTVTVIGAGTMGAGIAQVAAGAGYRTWLYDIDAESLGRGMARIHSSLEKGIARGKLDPQERDRTLELIQTSSDVGEAATPADLVVEAAPEQLALKQGLLTQLTAFCRPDCILATNTSSLSVTELARSVDQPGRFLGMHFFNPVPIMKLIEIVVGAETEAETVSRTREVSEKMGKTAITVKDSPGFATSRLGIVLGMEAIRMVESDVASAEDIDRAMTLGYAHPMGPLRLTDLVGLDVRLAISESLYRQLGEEAFRPPDLLRRMVSEGQLGKKSGRGFYDWS